MNSPYLKRLALFRLSAVGDTVLMVPVVRALQRTYPQLEITWITSPISYPILAGLSNTKFIIINKPHSVSSLLEIRKQLQGKSYDVLLAAQASLRANIIYPLINAPRKIGFDRLRSRDGHAFFITENIEFKREHLMDGFMRFAEALNTKDKRLEWNLAITNQHYGWAKQQLSIKPGPWLAVNPMSSKAERNWLPERYIDVINYAINKWHVNVVLTGGPSEAEIKFSQEIAKNTIKDCLLLTGKMQLKQMAALLSTVDAFLTPDTGPVHIATAMKTPVIGLYAVAPPELSGPYFSQNLVVNRYPDAVNKILGKDPATIAWGKRVHSPAAMKLITVADVITKLKEVF